MSNPQSVGQLVLAAAPAEAREGISLVSQVGTQDIVLIATTQHEQRCNREIAAWQEQVRLAQQAVSEKTRSIAKQTKEAAVLKLKLLLDKSRDFYSIWGLSFQNEVETEIDEKGLIAVSIHLFSVKNKRYGDSYSYENENTFTREFTFGELELADERDQLDGLKKDLAEKEESLRKWRTTLANIGTFERQSRAALAAHALQADDRGGALVNALIDAANEQVSDMPSLTQPIGSRMAALGFKTEDVGGPPKGKAKKAKAKR